MVRSAFDPSTITDRSRIEVAGTSGLSGREAAFKIGKRLVALSYDGPKASSAGLRAIVNRIVWAPSVTVESTWFDASSLLP